MSSLLGTSTGERHEQKMGWRAQIDEMKCQKQWLEEETNTEWMEYQQVYLELQEVKMRAVLSSRPPIRLTRPPTPGPVAAMGRPLVEAPPPQQPLVQQPPAPQLPAQQPSWGEMVEMAECIHDPMDTTQERPKEGTPYQQQVKAPTGTTGIGLVGAPSGQKASYSEATARGSIASGRGSLQGRPSLRGVSCGGTPGRGGRRASSSSSRERVTSPDEEEAPP